MSPNLYHSTQGVTLCDKHRSEALSSMGFAGSRYGGPTWYILGPGPIVERGCESFTCDVCDESRARGSALEMGR